MRPRAALVFLSRVLSPGPPNHCRRREPPHCHRAPMTLPHAAVPPISWLIALTVCNHLAFNASRVVVSLFAI
ncbi:MAG TPA: hypothetical protein DD502_01920, partial [Cupriavidus sp.]|nr:hypothetical protein [Cupriavidus sp.]